MVCTYKYLMEKSAANGNNSSYTAAAAMKNRLIRHCCQIYSTFYKQRHYETVINRNLKTYRKIIC
jgi:hypothetical protein